ncbi:MAG: universal stress protein [Pyrobaculum sp.]
MYRRVLVAYDGSVYAKNAVKHAVVIAKSFGASLYVITVAIDPSQVAVDTAKKIAKEAVDDIASQGLSVAEVAIRSGVPATEILNYAEEKEVDLIVMGSRGLSTLQRIVLGSVSQAVASRARVPVLIVK